MPSLSAYGVYGTTGFGNTGADSFFNFHPIGYVGTQLSIPLFTGTATRHKISQKKIELNKANIQKELVSERSALDINNAAMQYSLAKRTTGTAWSQIQLATRIYENTVLQPDQHNLALGQIAKLGKESAMLVTQEQMLMAQKIEIAPNAAKQRAVQDGQIAQMNAETAYTNSKQNVMVESRIDNLMLEALKAKFDVHEFWMTIILRFLLKKFV